MSTQSPDYETILAVVRSWPAAKRFTLVQDVLTTLAPGERVPRETLARARGLLATGTPVPTDQEIDDLLEQRRSERYGI